MTLAYNTPTGYKASTTGNITGIYDMSGGSYEYMSSYMPSSSDASGFTNEELESFAKYLDVYSNGSTTISWNNRILGDATGEMGPFYWYSDEDNIKRYHNSWYADDAYFIATTTPWFNRGCRYNDGTIGGQFYYHRTTGDLRNYIASRLVLAL